MTPVGTSGHDIGTPRPKIGSCLVGTWSRAPPRVACTMARAWLMAIRPDAIGSSTPPHIKEPDADLVRSSFLAEQPSVRHEYYILILRSTASHVSILMDNEFALGNNHPTQIGHCGCEL